MSEVKEANTTYSDAKRMGMNAIWLTKFAAKKEEFFTVPPDGDGVFRIVKHMDSINQDVVDENCLCNDAAH